MGLLFFFLLIPAFWTPRNFDLLESSSGAFAARIDLSTSMDGDAARRAAREWTDTPDHRQYMQMTTLST